MLIVPSLVGGLAGALLLRWTPARTFDQMVPFLILFATLLFMAQETVQRLFKTAGARAPGTTRWLAGAICFQLAVGIYGGYFGAGIGILMLAALSILGLKDIHEMNSLKVVFGGSINGIAAAYFVWAGMVYWPYVLVMAVGAIAGGLGRRRRGAEDGTNGRAADRDRHRLRDGDLPVHQEIGTKDPGLPNTKSSRQGFLRGRARLLLRRDGDGWHRIRQSAHRAMGRLSSAACRITHERPKCARAISRRAV